MVIRRDKRLYILYGYNQLMPERLTQIRTIPADKIERRYFVYDGMVFDMHDFKYTLDRWKYDGICLAVFKDSEFAVQIAVVTQ